MLSHRDVLMETEQPEAQQQQAWGYWECRFPAGDTPQAVACAWKPFAGGGSGCCCYRRTKESMVSYKRVNLLACCCHAEVSASCPNTNFVKGVQWAPDGSCCLTASDDNRCVAWCLGAVTWGLLFRAAT